MNCPRKITGYLLAGFCAAVLFLEISGRGAAAGSAAISPAAALGRQLFFDPSLSASGKLSCAGCHDPGHAYGPANDRAVQLGGRDLDRPGPRAVPSLRYTLDRTPRWSHVQAYSDIERLTETDDLPMGGFTWDGRFDSLHDQAMFPLFSPDEMANRDVADLARKLSKARYAGAFTKLFGKNIFAYPRRAVEKATYALERFQLEDPSFQPFSSKFDAWMDGKAALTAGELRGKRLFDDPDKGNCASCHPDNRGADGSHPIFTDFQFHALGVPRNKEIPANADPGYFDLGLCGPLRTDAANGVKTYCGLFKTPTLRNAAARKAFFHNGRFHSLKDVLRFYVQRDTDPARWYPVTRQGRTVKFDDLPPDYRSNVDVIDPPLNLARGQKPVWNDADIDDVIAFLKTLEDKETVK